MSVVNARIAADAERLAKKRARRHTKRENPVRAQRRAAFLARLEDGPIHIQSMGKQRS